jgi:phosphoenolpyruvate carboxykinase (ATP)
MEKGSKKFPLESQGLKGMRKVHWDLSVEELYELSLARGESKKSAKGPLVAITGKYTGRSPNDKFFVREPTSEKKI